MSVRMYSLEYQDLLTLKHLEPVVSIKKKRFDEHKQHIRSLSLEWNCHDSYCADDDDEEHETIFEYEEETDGIEVYYIDTKKEKNDEIAEYVSKLQNVMCNFEKIKSLHLARYPFQQVPNGIGDLTTLQSLEIQQCDQLTHLPTSLGWLRNLKLLVIQSCDKLEQLPPEIEQLRSLKMLQILECCALESLPPHIGNLRALEFLQIKNNHSLCAIPPDIGRLRRLKRLEIYGLPRLTSLPTELGQLGDLEMLNLISLPGIETLPPGFGSLLWSLQHLEISCCPRLLDLQNLEAEEMRSLRNIRLSYMDLQSVSPDLKGIPNLERMELSGLPPTALLDFFQSPWAISESSSPISTLVLRGLFHREIDRRLGDDYSKILSGLPESLSRLDLDDQCIDSLDGFLRDGLPSKIRRLSLHDNPVLKSQRPADRKSLEQLLHTYPKLGWIGWDLHLKHLYPKHGLATSACSTKDQGYKIFTPTTTHLLLFNRCGRALLGEDPNNGLPLSIWPTILARVHRELWHKMPASAPNYNVVGRSMECSVIYSLLQGPAFLSRPRD